MTKPFAATSMTHTTITNDARHVEISLANAFGQTQTLIFTPELCAALSSVLHDFARTKAKHAGALTKMPQGFAVGSGVHDSVVLVRFENDVPYGLDPDAAAVLGRALLDQSKVVGERTALQLQ